MEKLNKAMSYLAVFVWILFFILFFGALGVQFYKDFIM